MSNIALKTDTADDVRRQMREVRSSLRCEMDAFVENARVMTDWRYHVRRHPWVALGVAAGIGFVVVPSKTRVVEPSRDQLAELVARQKLSARSNGDASVLSTFARSLAGTLIRVGAGIAAQRLNSYVSQKFQAGNQPPPPARDQ